MPYDFPPTEQVQITTRHDAGPVASGAPGNFGDMYEYIAARLELPAQADQSVRNSRAWFLTATDTTRGQGLYSVLIRSYTYRQCRLHGVPCQPTIGTGSVGILGIQESSNEVARNVYQGLHDGVQASPPRIPFALPPWQAPSIPVIAEADATAIGRILFVNALSAADTAVSRNAAWTGAPLFTLLGSDETWRLISTTPSDTVADTLDDYRNILYAQNAYVYAVSEAAQQTGLFGLIATGLNPWSTESRVACKDAAFGSFASCVRNTLEGSIAEPFFAELDQFGICRATHLVRSGYLGAFVGGDVEYGKCVRRARSFAWSPFLPLDSDPAYVSEIFRQVGGIPGQQVSMVYRDPLVLGTTALSADADRLEARQALEALSPYLIKGGVSPTPVVALEDLTDRYVQDRVEMLGARLAFDRARVSYGSGAVDVPDFSRTVIFSDTRDSITLDVDNSPLPSTNTARVMFGSANSDTILGAGGDDALYGRDGADQLTGNAGNDYFEGGVGNDTYSVGAGNDVVYDADGIGLLRFNSVALTGGPRLGTDVWQSTDSRFRFTRYAVNGELRLLITDQNNSDTAEVRAFDFANGALGISLPGATTPVPATQTTAPGDSVTGRRNLYNPGSSLSDLVVSGNLYDNVFAGDGDDVIFTGGDNDRIFAGNGRDSVFGEGNRDYIRSGVNSSTDAVVIAADADTVEGGQDLDDIYGGVGADTLYAGTRTDVIDATGANTQGDWILGGQQDDALFGSIQRDFLNGGAGRDLVLGGSSDDTILGDGDYDFFLAGNVQQFTNADPGAAAQHQWNGSAWTTQASGTLPAGGTIDMTITPNTHFEFSITYVGDDFVFLPAVARSPTFLVRVASGGSNDVLRGGPGNDWIAGQTGDDVLFGEAGNDRLIGDDVVSLPAGSLPGNDLIFGGAGNDRLLGNQRDDTLYGDDGDDELFGDDNADAVGGADRLYGGKGVDQLYGNAGADQLFGEDGDDGPLVGGSGDDEIRGGRGNDTLAGDGPGQTGNDLLSGDEGDDTLMGDGGNDTLLGGVGADTLSGDDGDDTLVGGLGIDTMSGGAGADRFRFEFGDDDNGATLSVINDTGNGNRIVFASGIYPQLVRLTTAGSDLIVDYTPRSGVRVVGGAGGAVIGNYEFADGRVVPHQDLQVASAADPRTKALLALNQPSEFGDYIEGTAAADSINLLGGIDIAFGLDGNDILDGGDGDDILDGVGGDDTVRGGNGNDRLWGADGNDTLEGGVGDDDLFGGANNDNLDGGIGADLLVAGTGDDTLVGGDGGDTLQGGFGADLLQGGAGADVYVFAPGDDPAPGVMPATRIEDIASPDVPNTIRFEDGILVDNVTLQIGIDAFVTLSITYANATTGNHAVQVKCGSGGDVLNRFEFGDGSVYTFQQMLARQGLVPASSSSCPRSDAVFKNGFEGP